MNAFGFFSQEKMTVLRLPLVRQSHIQLKQVIYIFRGTIDREGPALICPLAQNNLKVPARKKIANTGGGGGLRVIYDSLATGSVVKVRLPGTETPTMTQDTRHRHRHRPPPSPHPQHFISFGLMLGSLFASTFAV
jgi:hypothetical protein